jgi:hypothetical protein
MMYAPDLDSQVAAPSSYAALNLKEKYNVSKTAKKVMSMRTQVARLNGWLIDLTPPIPSGAGAASSRWFPS